MRSWFVSCLLVAAVAVAAPKKPNVVLSGPPAVTKLVSKTLSQRYTPKVSTRRITAQPTAKEVRNVTEPDAAVALVLCSASGKSITLQVLNGADGTPLDTITLAGTAKKPPKSLSKPQLASLLFAVGAGQAPGKQAAPERAPEPEPVKEEPVAAAPEPEPEPEPVKEEPKPVAKKKAEPEPEPVKEEPPTVVEDTSTPTPSPHGAFRATFGVGGFNRSLSWLGNQSSALSTVTHPFSGAISVDASWYPGAHFTSGVLGHFGAFISADIGMGLQSRIQNTNILFAQSASRIRVGALARLPIGDRFNVFAHVGYSRHALATSPVAVNADAAKPNYPDVLFNGFRAGLGLRLRLVGTLELDALGGFQLVAGKGELATQRYFPNATAFAIDAGGGLSVELIEHVRLRAGAEWQRYFVTLNPGEDATFVARAAADQYISVNAGLQWSM